MQTNHTSRWVMFAAAIVALIVALTPLAAQDDNRIPISPAASYTSDGTPNGDALAVFLANPTASTGTAFTSETALVMFTLPDADSTATQTGDPITGYHIEIANGDAARFAFTHPILETLSARPEGFSELPTTLNQALHFWGALTTTQRPTSAVEFGIDGRRALIAVIGDSELGYNGVIAIDMGEAYAFITTAKISADALNAEIGVLAGWVNTIDLNGDAFISPEVTAEPEITAEPEATLEPVATTVP